ncbi:MAG: hypothetical protein KDA24_28145, partial [Deltaproteobacteria bacterium]|nr:hypothetical protein [Deltaproteobacteria bacterium]
MRLVRDELANRAVAFPFALFATDKDHGGLGPLPQRLLDGAAVVRRFRATLRATRPRVVHLCCGSGWGLKEASVLTVLAKNAGAFVVIHLHAASLFERMDDSAVERPLSLAALRRADAVAVLQRAPPGLVVQIPLHGALQPFLDRHAGPPAQ